MTERYRLDAALAMRALARSRSHAAKLIAAGLVTVNGQPVVKPSAGVDETDDIQVAGADHYVSRAAHKLIAALDEWPVAVRSRLALDAGASTGGFTQVLLERGARTVLALDVGHGQLAQPVASDPRVISIEGVNVRYLTGDELAEVSGTAQKPQLVTADLSFISLRTVLPALVSVADPAADFVLLIKPQFEVGRTGVREGIVHDAGLREDAVTGVLWTAWDLGIGTAGVSASPIAGTHGNREYLAWLNVTAGGHPTEWLQRVRAMVGA
ncbi:MAG TPA: TlyA family RNA methyltransferase [Humibacter sp.]|nr:TlyA family RNA methyltransferase [Humibacter sp.]